jgi:hypothetical protein
MRVERVNAYTYVCLIQYKCKVKRLNIVYYTWVKYYSLQIKVNRFHFYFIYCYIYICYEFGTDNKYSPDMCKSRVEINVKLNYGTFKYLIIFFYFYFLCESSKYYLYVLYSAFELLITLLTQLKTINKIPLRDTIKRAV